LWVRGRVRGRVKARGRCLFQCQPACASDSPTRLSEPARSTRCSLPLRGRGAPCSRRSMPG